jgi:sulfite dehydrogenase
MTKLTCAIAAATVLAAPMLGTTAAQRGGAFPPETAAYRTSDLPGYQLVQRDCLVCHSANYVTTQPPSLARTYWDATVKKMKKPFGAQFPDEDIAPIVDYLAKTYGAERPGAAPAK